MSEFLHVSLNSVIAIHDHAIKRHGGLSGIRSIDLLESAIAAPQASFGGQSILTDGVEVAAAYLYYLAKNHPFLDGNKRTALGVCLTFLKTNGLFTFKTLDVDKWERLVVDLGSSELDRGQTTDRLRVLIKYESSRS